VLLIRLLKIHRQPTIGFALLGTHQAQSPGFRQPYVLCEIKLHEIINERFSWVPVIKNKSYYNRFSALTVVGFATKAVSANPISIFETFAYPDTSNKV
ncbi:LOW QUALITY PROTEIN: hypothetical protein T265_12714, partial [Opisthorchis viverrini]